MQQHVDTRKSTDCHYFLTGNCYKGNSCPFLHDPTKITLTRAQQGQQDCSFFFEGRCKKGSLCPFKHDQAKLDALRLVFGGTVPPGAIRPGMPFAMPAASAPAAVQQPITVDFGGDAGPALQALSAPLVSAPPALQPVAAFPGTVRAQPLRTGDVAPAAATARIPSQSQQQPAASAPAARPGLRVGQQEQQRAHFRQQEQQQQRVREVPQQPQKRRQPDPLEASAAPFIPARLAGRLALPSDSPTRSASDGERQSPKRLRVGRQAPAAAPRVVVDEDEGAGRPHVRRGGGVRGLVASAIQKALGGPEQPAEPKLRRTILLGDEVRLGKRRMSGTDEQSVKFAVDEVPALASSSPPKPAKRQPQAEQGAGRAPGRAAAQQGQRRVGSPSVSAPAAAAPQQADRAQEGASKQEQSVFQAPRSLQELRQVRRQQSGDSQGMATQAATSQQAGQARPRRHRPIVWQPETAAAAETAEQAPTGRQPGAAEARPAARPAPATSPPAATPAAKAASAAAAAPAVGSAKPQVERSAGTLPVPAAQEPLAVASKPAELAPREDERARGEDERDGAAAAQDEKPSMEDADLDLGDEEFDYGGEEGDGGDEMDDFEAQMRALQEQL